MGQRPGADGADGADADPLLELMGLLLRRRAGLFDLPDALLLQLPKVAVQVRDLAAQQREFQAHHAVERLPVASLHVVEISLDTGVVADVDAAGPQHRLHAQRQRAPRPPKPRPPKPRPP